MSLARLTHVKKTRKDWVCTGCGKPIPAGSPAINFSVGYLGRSQYRHSRAPECFPTREQRESSAIAPIYGAIDGASFDGCEGAEAIQGVLEEVADVISEVISEYEGSPMFDVSEDLQVRVGALEIAEEELRSWEPDDEEPEGEAAKADWLEKALDDAHSLLENLELP